MPFSRLVALLVLVLSQAHATSAQDLTEPAGSEFQVNVYTTGNQYAPDVAITSTGDMIVVWASSDAETDTDSESVQARRYSASGDPLAAPFRVNTYTTSSQRRPAVASQADGGFVVVWQSFGSDNGDAGYWSVQAQRFDSGGAALGGQILVNTTVEDTQWKPDVASDASGAFVVVWQSTGEVADPDSSIQGQRFTSDGMRAGGQFQLNTYTTSEQAVPQVSMNSDGAFVVAWNGADDGDYGPGVRARRFASDGSPSGEDFRVNTDVSYIGGPDVAIGPDGDFTVVWASVRTDNGDLQPLSIQGQRYASDGDLVGENFVVNSYTTGDQNRPAITADPRGDLVVAWHSSQSVGDSSGRSVQAQRLSSAGDVIGQTFQVNTYTTDSQVEPAVAVSPSGDFVVLWQSYGSDQGDTWGDSIAGQRYRVAIFVDGFESGDLSLWSETVP